MSKSKTCNVCKETKLLSEFHKKLGGYTAACSICSNDYRRERKQTARDFIWEWKKNHPCSCGEEDPRVLDFDHLRDKDTCIAMMLSKGCSVETIKKEIDKCQVLCVKCHRIKTWEENHPTYMMLPYEKDR